MRARKIAKVIYTLFPAVMMAALPLAPAAAQPPNNDSYSSATDVSSLPANDTEDTSDATRAADDPGSCTSAVGPTGNDQATVWFAYTASKDISIEADTKGSDYNTVLAAYSGNEGSLTEEACNNDWDDHTSLVRVDVDAGETIHFMVAAPFGADGGELHYSFHVEPPPLEMRLKLARVAFLETASGNITVRGNLDCSRSAQVQITGEIEQKNGGKRATSQFQRKYECAHKPLSWNIKAEPYRGHFEHGRATLSAVAEAYNENTRDKDSSTTLLKPCDLVGTPNNDRLIGFHTGDVLCGLGGNDVLIGKGGGDRLIGGPGKDVLKGGAGNDLLIGGPEPDKCIPGPGRNQVKSC